MIGRTLAERLEGESAGIYYWSLAGEQFKVTRTRPQPDINADGRFHTNVKISLLSGNKRLNQESLIAINPQKGIVKIADLNVKHEDATAPAKELRGRNLFRLILEESKLIGHEFFGNQSFKIQIYPIQKRLSKLYASTGFYKVERSIDLPEEPSEKIANALMEMQVHGT
jgi:hypothetical protein